MKRHEADLKTLSALKDIISSQTARTPKIEAIVSLGYDSKDALLQSHERAVDFDDHLARRYGILVPISLPLVDIYIDIGLAWHSPACISLLRWRNGLL
jgi:hypothetical protein